VPRPVSTFLAVTLAAATSTVAGAQAQRPAPARAAAAADQPRGLLAAELAPLFARPDVGRHATWGALVVSLTRGDTLFSWRADRRLIPASNAKLFTTAAALHYLSPDFRFITVLYPDGRIRDGELDGDLVFYGTGDPTFAMDERSMAAFADSVVLAGVRRVRGDLIADASFLGGELRGPGWVPDNVTSSYAVRPQALGANGNRIELIVEPGPRRGTPARVRVAPANDYYAVVSVVLTGEPGSRTRVRVRRGQPRGGGVVELSGTIAADYGEWSTQINVEEPAVFAATLLRTLLTQRGVTVNGVTRTVVDNTHTRVHTMLARSAARGDAFAGALAVHRSAPLGELVAFINHRSHNLSAELTFRAVGRMRGGTGTFASGAQAVARFLTDEVHIPRSAVQVTDGSGLSLLDLASPRSLVQLLAYMRTATEGGREFVHSLPLMGVGYRARLAETAAAGRLRAKTGTLSAVSSLSGYVTAVGGEELAFSLIVNQARSVDAAREVQDSIGARLAAFTRPPLDPARASGN